MGSAMNNDHSCLCKQITAHIHPFVCGRVHVQTSALHTRMQLNIFSILSSEVEGGNGKTEVKTMGSCRPKSRIKYFRFNSKCDCSTMRINWVIKLFHWLTCSPYTRSKVNMLKKYYFKQVKALIGRPPSRLRRQVLK